MTTTKDHQLCVVGSRHAPHNLTYPNAANRIAGTNEGKGITLTSTQLYQFAKQDDTQSLWMLTVLSPITWMFVADGSMGAAGTLDDSYDAESGDHIVTMDDGDVSWTLSGAYSLNVQLAAATGVADGFQVLNGTDEFTVLYVGANTIDISALAGDIVFAYTSFTTEGSTADGSTKCQEWLDSGSVSVADIDTDGNLTIAGTITTIMGTSYGHVTRAQMLALSPSAGDEVYCTTYDLKFIYNGSTWNVQGETDEFQNKSGGALVEGDVVCIDASNDIAVCATAGCGACVEVAGCVVLGGADNAQVTVASSGVWTVNITGTVVRTDILELSGTAKLASTSTFGGAGAFAIALEDGPTTVQAKFFGGTETF